MGTATCTACVKCCGGVRLPPVAPRSLPTHLRAPPPRPPVQLFVLFGLPALVLVLSYAFNEPTALMISIPILLLIPGIRGRWGSMLHGHAICVRMGFRPAVC